MGCSPVIVVNDYDIAGMPLFSACYVADKKAQFTVMIAPLYNQMRKD